MTSIGPTGGQSNLDDSLNPSAHVQILKANTQHLILHHHHEVSELQNEMQSDMGSGLDKSQIIKEFTPLIHRVLDEHEKELHDEIANNPQTKNLPQDVISKFIEDEIASQKITLESVEPNFGSARPKGKTLGAAPPPPPSPSSARGSSPPPHAGENPPANEKTLDIDGYSVYKKVINGQTLYIPISNPLYTPGGDPSDYTCSEAYGYAMRNAVMAGDKTFFDQLLTSYLYFCNQTSISRNTNDPYDSMAFGLMGWCPDMKSDDPNGAFPGGFGFTSSATDADEDIISAMMMGLEKWGNITITDNISTSNVSGLLHSSISLQDLLNDSITNFVNCDIGTLTENGKEYSPVLTNDNWGHDPLFADYFDPAFFENLVQYEQTQPSLEGLVSRTTDAAKNTMQMIFDSASANNWWIPDNPNASPGPGSFGYDACRFLMRMGQFLLESGPNNIFGETFYNQAKDMLSNLVGNIYNNMGSLGVSGGALDGPLLVALVALNKIGDLPPNVTEQTITDLQNKVNQDLTEYDPQNWRNSYFSIQLLVLSEAIIKQDT